MIKVSSIVPKGIKRYAFKNTVNAKCERCTDIGTLSTLGVVIQTARLPHWAPEDIGLTAGLGTIALKSIVDFVKNRILLMPIIKRAKQIKSASKH